MSENFNDIYYTSDDGKWVRIPDGQPRNRVLEELSVVSDEVISFRPLGAVNSIEDLANLSHVEDPEGQRMDTVRFKDVQG